MKNKKRNYIWRRGDVLIEAVLAIAITAIVITGIVVALTNSISNSNFTKNQNLASDYAQEGLEVARNMKDTSFASLSSLSGTYCLPEGQTTIVDVASGSTCSVNVRNTFIRSVYVNPNGIDGRSASSNNSCMSGSSGSSIFVASAVSWSDSKCPSGAFCHKVELNSCFIDLDRVF